MLYLQSSIFPLICANLPPKSGYRETVLQVQSNVNINVTEVHKHDDADCFAKSRSVKGASHMPAFMGSCLTISHMCLPCLPGGEWASPCVIYGPL